MPFETWLLLILSVVVPLAIELKFFFTHRNENQGKVDRKSDK